MTFSCAELFLVVWDYSAFKLFIYLMMLMNVESELVLQQVVSVFFLHYNSVLNVVPRRLEYCFGLMDVNMFCSQPIYVIIVPSRSI